MASPVAQTTSAVAELASRAPELMVASLMFTYHNSDGSVVVAAFGAPIIDLPNTTFTARARTAEVACKRLLVKLTAKRRLQRIAELVEAESEPDDE